ncbi:hypothetical protein [Streptacidiphilus jiangxiensis]|uniref:Uncharacterized protein n=1 Tax=Streptacidiphilus jiangxiensis TaxID=235985 RepID=A0A1H7RAF5_STRJI|nr:hypothetical protein [Streptacidiphilus jiangxiensis]SEL57132.1 hypothetical protein SAMN05414137_11012 [Streptacidiphilus jiangxiensis]
MPVTDDVSPLPHISTPVTKTLGALGLLFATISPWLLLLQPSALRPRWDVLATGVAALALGFAWLAASRRGPVIGALSTPRDAAAEPPGVPARIPRARGHRILVMALLMALTFGFALVQAELLGRGPSYEQVSRLQRAGAVVMVGRVTQPPDLTQHTDWSSKHAVVTYTGDLDLRVDEGHGGTTVIPIHDATLDVDPAVGDAVDVLTVPGHPELGGYVSSDGSLQQYVPWQTVVTWPGGLLLFLLLLIGVLGTFCVVLAFDRTLGRVVREDAVSGPVPALRVRPKAATRKEKAVPGDRAGTEKVEVTTRIEWVRTDNGRAIVMEIADDVNEVATLIRLAEQPGWLIGARRWKLIKYRFPVVFVSDDGYCVWGSLDRYSEAPEGFGASRGGSGALPAVATTSRTDIRMLPRPTWARPDVHLVPLLLATATFGLTVPMLLDQQSTGVSLLLALASAAVGVTAAVQWVRRTTRARASLPWRVTRIPL